MQLRKIYKRLMPLFTTIIIIFMTLVDSAIYRPMEAYAFDIALDGAFTGEYGSLFSDLLYSTGMKTTYGKVLILAKEFSDYAYENREEIIAEHNITMENWRERFEILFGTKRDVAYQSTTHTNEDGTIHGGGSKSFTLSGVDIMEAGDFMDSVMAGESISTVPPSFVNMFRAWSLGRFNISAVDGTAPRSTIIVPMDTYMNSFAALPSYLESYDGLQRYTSSGKIWCFPHKIKNSSAVYVRYCAKIGTTMSRQDYDTITGTWKEPFTYTFSGPTLSGYVGNTTYVFNEYTYPRYWGDPLTTALGAFVENPPAFSVAAETILLQLEYSNPTIDLAYADGNAITWNGSKDLASAIENQGNATNKEEYIGKVITAAPPIVVPTEAPVESESAGTGEGGDITLTGILDWLSKIYNGVIALPGNIANSIASGWTKVTDAISDQTLSLGEWVSTIPETLVDIRDKIMVFPDSITKDLAAVREGIETFPDNVTKELTKIRDLVDTFPAALIGIKDAALAIPKDLSKSIADFFAIDTVRISKNLDGMEVALKAKLSALQQIRELFSKTGSFDDTIPVIYMDVPEPLQSAFQGSSVVVMDLRPFGEMFIWCRRILTAALWMAFAQWIANEFDVKFHVG